MEQSAIWKVLVMGVCFAGLNLGVRLKARKAPRDPRMLTDLSLRAVTTTLMGLIFVSAGLKGSQFDRFEGSHGSSVLASADTGA